MLLPALLVSFTLFSGALLVVSLPYSVESNLVKLDVADEVKNPIRTPFCYKSENKRKRPINVTYRYESESESVLAFTSAINQFKANVCLEFHRLPENSCKSTPIVNICVKNSEKQFCSLVGLNSDSETLSQVLSLSHRGCGRQQAHQLSHEAILRAYSFSKELETNASGRGTGYIKAVLLLTQYFAAHLEATESQSFPPEEDIEGQLIQLLHQNKSSFLNASQNLHRHGNKVHVDLSQQKIQGLRVFEHETGECENCLNHNTSDSGRNNKTYSTSFLTLLPEILQQAVEESEFGSEDGLNHLCLKRLLELTQNSPNKSSSPGADPEEQCVSASSHDCHIYPYFNATSLRVCYQKKTSTIRILDAGYNNSDMTPTKRNVDREYVSNIFGENQKFHPNLIVRLERAEESNRVRLTRETNSAQKPDETSITTVSPTNTKESTTNTKRSDTGNKDDGSAEGCSCEEDGSTPQRKGMRQNSMRMGNMRKKSIPMKMEGMDMDGMDMDGMDMGGGKMGGMKMGGMGMGMGGMKMGCMNHGGMDHHGGMGQMRTIAAYIGAVVIICVIAGGAVTYLRRKRVTTDEATEETQGVLGDQKQKKATPKKQTGEKQQEKPKTAQTQSVR